MKKSDVLDWLLPMIFIALVGIFGIIMGSNHTDKNLRAENAELQIEIAEYKINEQWFEDYIEILEEKRDNVTAPIIDDFEHVIDLCCYYYEETDRLVSFGDWLQINYPELYSRLLNYF